MKVIVTRKLNEQIVKPLYNLGCEVSMWPKEDEPMPYSQLQKESKDAHAILTNVSDRISENVILKAEKLKVISTMAVGYDNIDINAASKRKILVGHTPDVLTEATADLTFGLLLAAARRLGEGMDVIRSGKWHAWAPMMLTGQGIYGRTIGIIGMGRIGEAVARRAKGFNMNVLYYNRNRNQDAEDRVGATYKEFDELLKIADFVVVLVPGGENTQNIIGARELALMKESAILINTSRGSNVDEKALFEALLKKEIFAAGLDVFETEPITADHPLLSLPNVVALPHIGSAEIETRIRMAEMAVENIVAALTGKSLPYEVNLQ